MSDTESFEQAMTEMAGKVASPYWIGMAERLRAAHDREIRDTAQHEFACGYHAGQHSMDAEHRAVAMRLRALPLDGGSHENLSQIARAVYHSDFGWTQGACAALRDELVRLMGGVSDDTCDSQCCGACADCDGGNHGKQEVTNERFADDCGADTGCGDGCGDLHLAGVTYDVLWNERRKAVCELRNMHLDTGSAVKKLAIALGIKWNSDNAVRSVTLLQKRLIHLLGGDQPSGIDVLRGADLSKKSVDAMSSRAEGQSQDDALMRVRLNAKTYAYQILELAGILGVDVNVGDNVADIGNAVMAKARHLADECNFSTPENDMDTEDAKPNPAETSDDEIDHVSFGTRSITNGTTGQPNGTCPDDVPMASITDELREWASYRHCKGMSHTDVLNIGFIANRIDEQFGRICQQQETVLQETIDEMTEECDKARREVVELRKNRYELQRECEELQEKLDSAEDAMNRAAGRWAEADAECRELQEKMDEYDSTHVELPRDANGEVFRVGCTVKMVERHPEVLLTVHSITLCDDGEWCLYAWDDKSEYSCNLSALEFEVCEPKPDTAESIVRDLSIGAVTESEAIERIEALNG